MNVLGKYKLSLRKWSGLLIIITAALLLELLSASQYYFTRILMGKELERLAETELTMKAILIKSLLNKSDTIVTYADSINSRHLYPSSFIILLSEDGKPIITPDEQRVTKDETQYFVGLINDSTVARQKSIRGHTTLIHFDTNDRDGTIIYAFMKGKPRWQIAVVCYDDEVYASLMQLRVWLLLLMLLAFGILLFVIALFARNAKKLTIKTLEQERIGSELRIATEIQRQMLPRENSITRSDVDIHGLLVPARAVGGDLYDFLLRNEKLFFCIGDVSGKGVPSAMVMAVTHSLFRSASAHEHNPARMMQDINETCCEGNEANMFVTFFIGVLDLPTGKLRYCNAGHDKPILITDGQLLPEDRKPNLPLGVFPDAKYEGHEFVIPAGSTLFLYTDGVTEAKNNQHKEFGIDRLNVALQAHYQETPHTLLQSVTDEVNRFVEGAEQSDDLTILAIRYTPKAEKYLLSETLTLKNDAHQVDKLSRFVKEVLAKLNLQSKEISEIRLAVEEAVVNVMEYAYPAGTEGDITIDAKYDGQLIKFVISDSGVAFDPTEAANADTTLSAEDRPIGGLGILLVRKLMDIINYERMDGKNVLTLKKTIKNQ